jgi:hypothetical protein
MENNYYNYETPYFDKPGFAELNRAYNKYKNITNVSQLSNYYIKQPNSNEFIIKCNNLFWGISAGLLISSGFLAGLICILIFDDSKNQNTGGIIFGICFSGFLACINLFGFLLIPLREKVILTENYIQIKSYRILCCFNSDKVYEYININSFQVDTQESSDKKGKDYNIVYLDIYNKKNRLFDHNFELEEAEYFVYVVNGFINKKKNMVAIP